MDNVKYNKQKCNGNNGKVNIKFSNDGKVLIIPMNHKKRINLVNFLKSTYSIDMDLSKKILKETLDNCKVVIISDLNKNELSRKFNFS